jgi:hypothetical protein
MNITETTIEVCYVLAITRFICKNYIYQCLNDLQSVNFENQIADDDVNRAYSKFETSFIEIIDKHIPIKKRKPVAYPVPYMNQNLRNAIYKKKMYHNKFLKQKTDKNWETYRKQRNLVTKLKKNFHKNILF